MKRNRKLNISRLIILLTTTFVFSFFVVKGFASLIRFRDYSDVCEKTPDLHLHENYEKLIPDTIDVSTVEKKEEYIPLVLNYDNAQTLTYRVESENVILVCADDGSVITSRNSRSRIFPASMTKVMTLIVALEHIDDLNDTFTMTYEITDPLYVQGATVMGLLSGETVPIIDLLYGAILPSGADATTALALYTAGSEEAFVEWMNEKVEELGLLDTHFTNTTGLHDADHYTTAYDMAVIFDYAMKNELFCDIISANTYKTVTTPQHPEGLVMNSTMFNRVRALLNADDRIELDGEEFLISGATLIGGKTGYTSQAGHCLVSVADKYGKKYIAVTAQGSSNKAYIYDIAEMYESYI